MDIDTIIDSAVQRAEQTGVVFVDEIDKITGPAMDTGPDVSGEGVQRDLLPIVEGSTVHTRYGPLKTDHVLFIAAGAFHEAKPTSFPSCRGASPCAWNWRPWAKRSCTRSWPSPKARCLASTPPCWPQRA